MLEKAKALYQVKLILDYLPGEEYELISKDIINYIEENYKYDENITIDPNVSLEYQKIDDKAYEMLEKIIESVENDENSNNIDEIFKYIEDVKESNQNYNAKIENVRLKNLIETLKKENSKIFQAKELLAEYNNVLKQKDDEIEKLKKNNQNLYNIIQGLPKIIKKIFIKDFDIKD